MNKNGFTIVEVLVVSALMAVLMLVMITMQSNQMETNNFIQFQMKRNELRAAIVGQFLNDPNNCACLFQNAGPSSFSSSASNLSLSVSSAPTAIGRYNFVTPGVCSTATIPQPLVNSTGIDNVRTTSIQLLNITASGSGFSGNLVVDLQSTKKLLGPQNLQISIPVNITTVPSGGNVNFLNCSIATPPPPAVVPSYSKKSCIQTFRRTWTWQFNNRDCNPSACAATETSSDLGCKAHTDYNWYTTISCHRLCFSGTLPSGFEVSTFCPFGVGGNGPLTSILCTTAPCPPGFVSLFQRCEATNTGSSKIGGYCEQVCRVP